MKMKRIVLTGGGTAGHVTPNIALIPKLQEAGYTVTYVGSKNGIEKELIGKLGIPYYAVSTGKLRRYFSLQNFADIFRVIKGFFDALHVLRKVRPDIVFSKGGFVSVPVVRAAKLLKIPVICHESDMTPGLANKLCLPAASVICCNFPETLDTLPADKAVLTGTPIRPELLSGDRKKGLAFAGLDGKKPVLLIIGGSLGAAAVNEAVRAALPALLPDFDLIHLTGKGKLDASLAGTAGYRQFEYISDELPDLFAAADLVISRAGANAICELLALKKPNILIPLTAHASRGDQILNAGSFEKQGYSIVLDEDTLTTEKLVSAVRSLADHADTYIAAMAASPHTDATGKILALIEQHRKQ